jgi:hypothetical protein
MSCSTDVPVRAVNYTWDIKITLVKGAASYHHDSSRQSNERNTSMMPNFYQLEQMARERRQNLLREAEHERLLAQLRPSHSPLLAMGARLIASLRTFRIRLWHRLQRQTA